MKTSQIEKCYYENASHLSTRDEKLAFVTQTQKNTIRGRIDFAAWAATTGGAFAPLAGIAVLGSVGVLAPPVAAAVGGSLIGGGAATFLAGVVANKYKENILNFVEKTKSYSNHIRDIRDHLTQVISNKEGIPKGQVFTSPVQEHDMGRIINLAFEKHIELEGLERARSLNGDEKFNKQVDALNDRFNAIEMSMDDRQAFDNAMSTIHTYLSDDCLSRFGGPGKLDRKALEINIKAALQDSANGKILAAKGIKIIEASTLPTEPTINQERDTDRKKELEKLMTSQLSHKGRDFEGEPEAG